MVIVPPAWDVEPPAEPDATLAQGVIDELAQGVDAARLPDQARVESDRHHAWMGRALRPQSDHSSRNATTGSTRVALSAGTSVARTAIPTRSRETAANVAGSVAVIDNKRILHGRTAFLGGASVKIPRHINRLYFDVGTRRDRIQNHPTGASNV